MKKSFTNVELLNIVAAWEQIKNDEEKVKDIPIKVRWAIKKNFGVISKSVKEFEEFRNEIIEEFKAKYFDEVHSEETVITETDENGNAITDNEGNVITQNVRKIKEEYSEEYKQAVSEINKRIGELLTESNEFEIYTVNMDSFVEGLKDNTKLTFDDIEMLTWIDETTNAVEG